MTETSLTSENPNAPRAVARRLSGHLAQVSGFCDDGLIPRASDESHLPRYRMAFGVSEILVTHIRRAEYQLRCFILWLAALLIEKGVNVPLQPVADPFDRMYDTPDPISPYMKKMDKQLRQDLREIPLIPGFSVTTPDIKSKRRKSRRRHYKFLPDPLRPVDISHLMARIARLPLILKRADKMALSLAIRAVRTRDRASSTRIFTPENTVFDRFVQPKPQTRSLYFQPLEKWLPPEDLWASARSDDERGDLNLLHYMARSALDKAGFDPDPPDPDRGLPDLSCIDPPAPPQIRRT